MSVSRPVALGVTKIADPVRLGPYLQGGNPGSVGARRLRDMPEVWDAEAPGTYLLAVDTDGAVLLVPTTPVSAQSYHHSQLAASTVWAVGHSLGYYPAGILAWDSTGDMIEHDDVVYVDTNTLHLVFLRAVSGVAELS